MTSTTQKTTNSGTNYRVADEGQKIQYDIASGRFAGKIDGENEYWNVYIPVSEIQNKCFPLNANPRQPNSIGGEESTDIVVKMRSTLKKKPSDFVRLNNGFTCVCSSLTPDDPKDPKSLEIEWLEGEGILNGGHTYLAVQSILPSTPTAYVRVEFIVLSSAISSDPLKKKQFIKDTAIARNSNRQLKPFTQAEFEGKHAVLQSHLGDLQSSIFWSEGFERLNPNLSESKALSASAYVSYLSALDRNWHWHPSRNPNPKGKDIAKQILTQGKKAYNDWLIVALSESNEMNLRNVAPMGPVLLKLVDQLRSDMKKIDNAQGKTIQPTGYGNKFTMNDMWKGWAGKGQQSKKSVTYYHSSGTSEAIQVPMSSAHYILWVLNYIRPFLWFGETDDDVIEFVGWHRDPIETYDQIHKLMIKGTIKDFGNFKKMGQFVTHSSTAKTIWDEIIEPIWEEHCSLEPDNNKFFPRKFFSPQCDSWYEEDPDGDHYLIFSKDEKEWRISQKSSATFESDDVYSLYSKIIQPY
jgi:hypothetical protein